MAESGSWHGCCCARGWKGWAASWLLTQPTFQSPIRFLSLINSSSDNHPKAPRAQKATTTNLSSISIRQRHRPKYHADFRNRHSPPSSPSTDQFNTRPQHKHSRFSWTTPIKYRQQSINIDPACSGDTDTSIILTCITRSCHSLMASPRHH